VVEELRIEPLDQEGLTDSGSAEPTKLGGVGNPPLACGAEGGSCGFRRVVTGWRGRVRRDRVLVVVECG